MAVEAEVAVGAAEAAGAAACLDPRAGPEAEGEAGPDRKHGRKAGLAACLDPRAVVEACPVLRVGLAA